MPGVQFDENYTNPNFNNRTNPEKGLANWLVNKGIAKNKKVAEYIMIGITIAFFALSFFIGF
jgi:hypothetical protein